MGEGLGREGPPSLGGARAVPRSSSAPIARTDSFCFLSAAMAYRSPEVIW